MRIIQGQCLKCGQENIAVLEPMDRFDIAYCLPCIEKAFKNEK